MADKISALRALCEEFCELNAQKDIGSVRPSAADIKQTGKLKDILNQMDIALNDHLIFGDGQYFSFSEEKISDSFIIPKP